MSFTVAPCLRALFAEIDAMAPGRSRATDGTIGDHADQQRKSDHNPDTAGVVRAIDVTHDPVGGADMAVIAERLRLRRNPCLPSTSSSTSGSPARTLAGTGRSSPATRTRRTCTSRSWPTRGPTTRRAGSSQRQCSHQAAGRNGVQNPGAPTPPEVVPGETSGNVLTLQLLLIRIGLIGDTPGNHDRHYGDATQRVVERFQRTHGLHPDKKVGPKTWAALMELDPR